MSIAGPVVGSRSLAGRRLADLVHPSSHGPNSPGRSRIARGKGAGPCSGGRASKASTTKPAAATCGSRPPERRLMIASRSWSAPCLRAVGCRPPIATPPTKRRTSSSTARSNSTSPTRCSPATPALSSSSLPERRTPSATTSDESARLLVLHAPALDRYFADLERLWSSPIPPDRSTELDLMRRHGMEPA